MKQKFTIHVNDAGSEAYSDEYVKHLESLIAASQKREQSLRDQMCRNQVDYKRAVDAEKFRAETAEAKVKELEKQRTIEQPAIATACNILMRIVSPEAEQGELAKLRADLQAEREKREQAERERDALQARRRGERTSKTRRKLS